MTKVKVTYIIDDDAIFVFVAKKLLEKHQNFGKIIDFRDGNEAIEVLFNEKAEKPCIIFLDLNMPLLDGWQFLDKLQEAEFKNDLNVFIMSSSIDANDIQKSKEYSVVKDFISKPINHDKLDSIINSLN